MLPRRSFLRRKSAGGDIEVQMVAANIDVPFIVQACHFNFNLRRLERYLVMARDGHVELVLLLTITDLVTPEALARLMERIRQMGVEAQIVCISNLTGAGVEQVRALIAPGKTYFLLGSSGVGKTTLINRLRGDSTLETREVSHTGEGRHTTTRRQLMLLAQGGLLIDIAGMRELGLLGNGDGIEALVLGSLAVRAHSGPSVVIIGGGFGWHHGGMTLRDITRPYEGFVGKYDIRWIPAVADAIDPDKKAVHAGKERIAYDRLIVSPGVDFNYESIPGMGSDQAQL